MHRKIILKPEDDLRFRQALKRLGKEMYDFDNLIEMAHHEIETAGIQDTFIGETVKHAILIQKIASALFGHSTMKTTLQYNGDILPLLQEYAFKLRLSLHEISEEVSENGNKIISKHRMDLFFCCGVSSHIFFCFFSKMAIQS